MRGKQYILFIFVSGQLMCQNRTLIKNRIECGFSHGTYNSLCFKKSIKAPISDKQTILPTIDIPSVSQIRYGFTVGYFLWMPITRMLSVKPQLETSFSNACIFGLQKKFATSFDVSFSTPFAFALKPPDPNGIIYIARNMSCYLTNKQPYLLIGPKCNFRKFDKGFINEGFQHELLVGFLIGYGIHYEFHGTSFSPEVKYSIETSKQNKINDSETLSHTISLAVNLF